MGNTAIERGGDILTNASTAMLTNVTLAGNAAGALNGGGPTLMQLSQVGSLVIDRGADCPATDQRGVARPQGGGCDIGAVEVEVPVQQ